MWKANRTAEQLARTSAKSYKMIVDHIVGLQERGVRFAWEIFDGAARETGHQTESNRELTERAEKQREAFQTLIGESAGAYRDLQNAPHTYYRQVLRLVEGGVNSSVFPIPNFD